MKYKLYSLLRIQAGEERFVWSLGAMMLLTSAGSAVGGASIDALFFARFGIAPIWYIILGGVNFLNLVLVAGIAGRVSRARLYLFLPVILTLVLLAAYILLKQNLGWIYPTLYIGKDVVNALQGVFLWGLAGSLLDARQSKRLFPLLIAGGIAGAMLGSFGIPLLVQVFGSEAMLAGWAFCVALTAWLVYHLISRHRRSLETQPSQAGEQSGIAGLFNEINAGFQYVRRSSLLSWFSLVALLFSVLWFALLLPFSRLSTSQYPDADQLAIFFGIFNGVWTAAALLVSLFITSRLFSRIGVINALIVYPLIYLVGFVILAIYPRFTAIVTVRFLQIVWSQSLAETAWQASFNAIPAERRDQARAFINAVPGQAGIVIAGLLLVIGEQTLLPQQLFLIGLVSAALCAWALVKSRRAYMRALQTALANGQAFVFYTEEEPFGGFQNDPTSIQVLLTGLADPDARLRRLSAEILGKLPPNQNADDLLKGLNDSVAEVRAACLVSLAEQARRGKKETGAPPKTFSLTKVTACLQDSDQEVRLQAVRTLLAVGGRQTELTPIETLLSDPDPLVQVETASSLIGEGLKPDFTIHLQQVLTSQAASSQPTVRQAALSSLARGWKTLAIPPAEAARILTAGLNDSQPSVRQAVWDGLAAIPPELEPIVRLALANEDSQVRDAAARAVGRSGQFGLRLAMEALQRRETESSAIDSLYQLINQPDADQQAVLLDYAKRKVRLAQQDHHLGTACLAAVNDERRQLLGAALTKSGFNHALLGLRAFGLAWDGASTALAVDALQSEDPNQIAYALETMEAVENSQVIQPLLALWEHVETGPHELPPLASVLDSPDPWLRACAAYTLQQNPDEQTAARLVELAKNDPDSLVRQAAGTSKGANHLETLQTLSTMERILFLRKVPLFADLPPVDLKHIASLTTERYYPDGAMIARQGEPGDNMFIIAQGEVRVENSGRTLALRRRGDCVGEMAIINQAPRIAMLTAVGEVRLLCLGQKEFETVLRQRPEVCLAVMRVLSSRLTEQAALLPG